MITIDNEYIERYINDNDIDISEFMRIYIKLDKFIRNNFSDIKEDQQEHIQVILEKLQNDVIHVKDMTTLHSDKIILELDKKLHNIREEMSSIVSANKTNDVELITNNIKNIFPEELNNSNFIEKIKMFVDSCIGEKTNSIVIQLQNSIQLLDNAKIIEDVSTKVTELNDKFKNSTRRGECSQNLYYKNLLEEFPDAEVKQCTDESHSCDYQILYTGKPTVLVELKDYTANVPKGEIDKFYSDIKLNKCSGVLVSLRSGIACKKDFSFEVIDREQIVVFLHRGGYDALRVRYACEMIYRIVELIKTLNKDSLLYIDEDQFDCLKEDFFTFKETIEKITYSLRENARTLDNIKLQHLETLIRHKTIIVEKDEKIEIPICEVCGKQFARKYNLHRHKHKQHPELFVTSNETS